jgi:hypothetical protein
VKNGEYAKCPAPTRTIQHRVRKESGSEGRDEIRRRDVGQDEASVLELRGIGKEHAEDIVSVAATKQESVRTWSCMQDGKELHSPGLAEDFGCCVHLDAVGRSHHDRSHSHQDDAEHKAFIASPHIDELDMDVSR